ncbi:MAG TPA: hypothetical protein VEW08_02605 [Steroidobacteraceae bacterium]|nr:hypothetical protein [Steroidobacteraceae bacterium]
MKPLPIKPNLIAAAIVGAPCDIADDGQASYRNGMRISITIEIGISI